MVATLGEVMGFKENLKRFREAKGWTQAEAARAAEVPFRSYQNWEIGGREPRFDALIRLARAFGVTPNDLQEGVGREPVAEESPAVPRPMGKRK